MLSESTVFFEQPKLIRQYLFLRELIGFYAPVLVGVALTGVARGGRIAVLVGVRVIVGVKVGVGVRDGGVVGVILGGSV
jgi:hypothetical protein